jgi:hypothetical protein
VVDLQSAHGDKNIAFDELFLKVWSQILLGDLLGFQDGNSEARRVRYTV